MYALLVNMAGAPDLMDWETQDQAVNNRLQRITVENGFMVKKLILISFGFHHHHRFELTAAHAF